MAEKSFGVKDINLVGAAGTPTLESNGELYINASHVAIQTNTTISGVCTATNKVEIRVDDGTPARIDYYCEVSDSHYTRLQSAAHADYSGNVEVTLPVTSGKIIVGNSTSSIDNNINTTGIVTAGTFSGSGASLTAVDAATLDGVDSTSFLRSDAADTKSSGDLTFSDDVKAIFGTGSDLEIYHFGGVGSYIEHVGDGMLTIRNSVDDGDVRIQSDNGSGSLASYFLADGSTGEAILYHYGTEKLATKSGGVTVTGTLTATSFSGDGSALTGINASVPANLTATTLNVSGVTTAANFRTNSTTGDGSDVGFAIKYYVTANGASHYNFAGPGLTNGFNDPTIYVHRGFTYIFENSTGTGHPFRIQYTGTTIGVGTYLSGSQSGTQVFTIPMDAPASYEYQCTIHSSMKGTLSVV
jgi:plastocyanin